MLTWLRLSRPPLRPPLRPFLRSLAQQLIMSKRTKIDVSPPVLRGMKELDRAAFHKTVPVLGAKVPKQMLGSVRSAAEVRKCVDAYLEMYACH